MESDAEIRAFVQAVNPARLATLKVVRIDQANRLLTDGREAQAMFRSQATQNGADEMTERIALYELSGQFFWSGFRLCRYDKSWKVCEFAAFYGGPSGAGVEKTTAADYEARLSADPGGERPPQAEATPRDAKPETAAPTKQDGAHPCKQPSANKGLGSPEAAVSGYVESIAANDFTCALRAYAAHENAARFDFTATVSWVKVLSPGILRAPAEYPMFVEINELRAKAEMAEATKLFVYGLLTDADVTGAQRMESDAEIQAFVQAVNPSRLATLKVVRIDLPRQSVINGTEAKAHFEKVAALEGADEMTERIALYELSGRFFWGGFRLSRYDKSWKVHSFTSNFGGPLGGAVVGKTTAAEYEARLK